MAEHRSFVVLEGIDASGKTTIRKLLYRKLTMAGVDVVATIPSSWLDIWSTRLITDARYNGVATDPKLITQAYVRDKETLTERLIEPQLRNRHVLMDRYILSDLVYHAVIWGIPPEVTDRAYRQSRCLAPDVTVWIDTPVEIAANRLQARGGARRPWELRDRQVRADAIYRELIGGLLGPPSALVVRFDNSIDGDLEDRVERDLLPLFAWS